VQFWTQYTTEAFNQSIQDYNAAENMLRQQDISYPVDGIVDFSPTSYEFPLTRTKEPLSIIQQCHSMLRASTRTHESVTVDGFETFHTVADFLAAGREWNPTDLQTGPQMSRRQMIHGMLYDAPNQANAIDALYDERYISEDSLFCQDEHAMDEDHPFYFVFDAGDLPEDIQHIATQEGTVKDDLQDARIKLWGFYSRRIGNMADICPCGRRESGQCTLHILDGNVKIFLEDRGVVLEDTTEENVWKYDSDSGPMVRELLQGQDFRGQYKCETQDPSDLFGLLPQNLTSYFSSQFSAASGSAADLLLFPKSGITASNLKFVAEELPKKLNEGMRMINVSDSENPVVNRLCAKRGLEEDTTARLGFPVLTSVAESPATSACLRFLFEFAWKEMLRETAGVPPAELAAAVEKTLLWGTRCQVKLKKLKSCQDFMAFDVEYTRRNSQDLPQRVKDRCNFTIAEADQGRLAVSHGPCVVVSDDKRFYDPLLCQNLSGRTDSAIDSAMLSASCEVFNPLGMLRVQDDVQFVEAPLLGHDFARQVLHNASYRASMGVLGMRQGHDWLFPDAEKDSQRQCSADLMYWPQHWQYPYGEILSQTHNKGAGFASYMAAIVSDTDHAEITEIATIPQALRPDQIVQTQSGSSGFCRENSLGMQVVPTNTHRLCSITQDCSESTEISDGSSMSKTCSSTPAASVGAGTGHTIGYLYPLLRPFVRRDHDLGKPVLNESVAQLKMATDILSLFEAYGEDFDLDIYEALVNIDDKVRRECNIDVEHDRDVHPTCWINTDCPNDRVCDFQGKCSPVDIEVKNNNQRFAIEFGIVALGAQHKQRDENFAGASPFQRVQGFLQHMGLCSHADTVTYERMRHSVEKNSADREENGNVIKASCVAHTDGRRKWWTCPRSNGSVPFNFINHPPLVLLPTDQGCTEDDNGIVECKQCQGEPCWRFLREYASDEEEADPVSTDAIHKHINTEFEFLRLQPHVCDPEYLHSKNLKWVELENKDEPDLVDYWMRMAENYGDVALVDRAHGDESVSCPDFVPPDTSTCKSQNKMRFLGLTGNDIMFYADDAPQEIVTDGRLCGLCTTEKFTYCGVDVVRLNSENKIKKYTEVHRCGSFADFNADGNRCELDLDVAALAWKVYDTASTCSELYNRHDRLQLDGETLYFATDDKNTIGIYLNRLLLAHELVFNAKEKRTQLYWFRHCVSEITQYINDRKPALLHRMLDFTGPAGLGNSDKIHEIIDFVANNPKSTGGLYMFTTWNTYEVPINWFEKHTLASYFFTTPGNNQISLSQALAWTEDSAEKTTNRQDAWEHRLDTEGVDMLISGNEALSIDSLFSAPEMKIRQYWSAINTDQLVPAKEHFIVQLSYQLSGVVSKIRRSSNGNEHYEYGRAKQIKFAQTSDSHHLDYDWDTDEKRSQLIQTTQAGGQTLQFLKQQAGFFGQNFDYLNQYTNRILAPQIRRCAGSSCFETFSQNDQYVPQYGQLISEEKLQKLASDYWIDPIEQKDVKRVKAAEGFYLESSEIEPFQHKFASDIIRHAFFHGENADNVVYFDPVIADTSIDQQIEAQFEELYDRQFAQTMIQEEMQKAHKIPLAVIKMKISSNQNLLTEILQDRNQMDGCPKNQENSISMNSTVPHAQSKANKRCIWNPRQRRSRDKDAESRNLGNGKTPSIEITGKDGKTITWSVCELKSQADRLNGFSTPQSGNQVIHDGMPCSFADFSERSTPGGLSAFTDADCSDNSSPSPFCDYRASFSHQEVRFEQPDVPEFPTSKCNNYDQARHTYALSEKKLAYDPGTKKPIFAGEMYFKDKKSPGDFKRQRKKLCHRIDYACVRQKQQYSDLFEHSTSVDANKKPNPNEMFFAALKARNPNQKQTNQASKVSMKEATGARSKWTIVSDAGPQCGITKIKVPKGVKVRAWKIRDNFYQAKASFADVVFGDRFAFSKKFANPSGSKNTEQIFFQHHYNDGFEEMHHTTPSPGYSFCSDAENTKLHRFKKVDFRHPDVYKRIMSKVSEWDWDLGINAENLEALEIKNNAPTTTASFNADKVKPSPQVDIKPTVFSTKSIFDTSTDSEYVGYIGTKQMPIQPYNVAKYHQILQSSIAFSNGFNADPPTDFNEGKINTMRSYTCIPPELKGTPLEKQTVGIWNLSVCYQNNFDEVNDDYLWRKQTLCDTTTRFLDGTLSQYFFKWLTRPYDMASGSAEPPFRTSFQFSELLTGSSVKLDGKGELSDSYKPSMSKASWSDSDTISVKDSTDGWPSIWKELDGPDYESYEKAKYEDPRKTGDGALGQLFGWSPNLRARTVPYIPGFFETCNDRTQAEKMVFINGRDQYPYVTKGVDKWRWQSENWFQYTRLNVLNQNLLQGINDVAGSGVSVSDNIYKMCYNEIQAELNIAEEFEKDDTKQRGTLGNVEPAMGNAPNSKNNQKIHANAKNFWRDFVSLRNLKLAENVCQCADKVPLWRTSDVKKHTLTDLPEWSEPGLGDGGAIFASYGLYERRKKKSRWDKFMDSDLGWLLPTVKVSRMMSNAIASLQENDKDPNGFRYGEKESDCWEEKENNDDRCDFYNPDLYSRAGGVLSESFCQQYCSDYTLQDLTPLPGSNAQKRALIMSKLMGSNFKHNTEDAQQNWANAALDLSPCIQGQSDEKTNTMRISYAHGSWKADPDQEYDAIWNVNEKEARSDNPYVEEYMARTFLRSFMGKDGKNYEEGPCRAGGSKMHVVTKPSFWADVESNPREIVVPCRPDEPDGVCESILEEINLDAVNGDYSKIGPDNDGVHGIKFNTGGSNSKICAYEIELEDTAADIAECDFACDEFNENGNDCSKWVDESADKCYFESHHTKSLLRNTDDDTNSNLVQCQSCAEYNLDENIVTDTDLDKTCLGRGVYYEYDPGSSTSPPQYHPISAQADSTHVQGYIDDIQTDVIKYLSDPLQRDQIVTQLNEQLKNANFTMTDAKGVRGDHIAPIHGVNVKIEPNDKNENIFVFVYIDAKNSEFLRITDTSAKISRQSVEMWAHDKDEISTCTSAIRANLRKTTCGAPSRFKRFDPYKALVNAENIQTDFEDGCSQTENNIASALEAKVCKDVVSNRTLHDLKEIIDEVYKKQFGLRVHKVHSRNQSTFTVSSNMSAFSWYEGVLPWYSADQHERNTDDVHDEMSPFLDSLVKEEWCQDEFMKTSVGRSPCFRDRNNTPHILVPFLADRYAWPKGKTSVDMDRAFGTSCDPSDGANGASTGALESCLRHLQNRVTVLENYMIGSDLCFYDTTEDEQRVDLYKLRSCFASFCTENSHIGTPTSEECINTTDPGKPCSDSYSDDCECFATNAFHENKTICRDSREINSRITDELPGRRDMKKIRRLYEDGKFRKYQPTHPRCETRLKSATDMASEGQTCNLAQGPIGYSESERRNLLMHRYATTLSRTEEIHAKHFANDTLSVFRLSQPRQHSLWQGGDKTVSNVLGAGMAYPAGSGDEYYALLRLDPAELGPNTMALQVNPGDQRLQIAHVQLTQEGQGLDKDWVSKLPESIQVDRNLLGRNPLYSGEGQTESGGKHWMCPFVHLSLVSGGRNLYQKSKVKLVTPNPHEMHKRYPLMKGLHPIVKSRDVEVLREVEHYQHVGLLHSLWDGGTSEVNLLKEIKLFFKQETQCHNKSDMSSDLLLGWPHVNNTLRSEEFLQESIAMPHDLSPLAKTFQVLIKHDLDLNVTRALAAMFETQGPYHGNANRSANRNRTTLDRGMECNKGPLSVIPRSKLQRMLAFDTCFLVYEDADATTRNYTCQNQTAEENFVFKTTHFRNYKATESVEATHQYKLCTPPTHPAHTIWTGVNKTLPAENAEISLSMRRRISPFHKRIVDLEMRHNGTAMNLHEAWERFSPGGQSNPILPPVLQVPGTSGVGNFDEDWVYRCPPSTGAYHGRISYDSWSTSTTRRLACDPDNLGVDVDTSTCNVSKAIDLCKYQGFEDLCVLIRKYKDDIRRANMRKVSLVTDTTELYTPSSFYYQDNQYAWEIVSRVYDSMGLIAQNRSACSNVQQSVNMIDKAIEDHTSLGHIKCPSQVVRFYVFYVAKVRSIAIMLANMALTFSEAVWNMFLAIIALFIETLQDYKLFEGQSGVAFFINRAFNLVLKTLNYARKFFEDVIMLMLRTILENPTVRIIIKLLSAACELFKRFVKAILSFIQSLLNVLRKVTDVLRLSSWSNALNRASQAMEREKQKVDSWNCVFGAEDICKRVKCKQSIEAMVADTCYQGLMPGSDVLQGRTSAVSAASTTWVGIARGSFQCDDTSYCRRGLGDIVYCNECNRNGGTLLPEYYCGVDSKCACGTKPDHVDQCYSAADCGPAQSCQEVYKGFDVASVTSRCQTTSDEFVTCLKAEADATVGICSKVLGYDYEDDCKKTFANLDGFCFVLPVEINADQEGLTEVPAASLFSVPCSTLTVERNLEMTVDFGNNQQKCTRVYSQTRRAGGRRLLQEDTGPTHAAPESILGRFVDDLQPRMHEITGGCGDIFTRDLSQGDTAERAMACARKLLFLNITLQGTNLSDHHFLDLQNATRTLQDHPDLLAQIAGNLPLALSVLAADYTDAPALTRQGQKVWEVLYRSTWDIFSADTGVVASLKSARVLSTSFDTRNPSTSEQFAQAIAAADSTVGAQAAARDTPTSEQFARAIAAADSIVASQPAARRLLQVSPDTVAQAITEDDVGDLQQDMAGHSNQWSQRGDEFIHYQPDCLPFSQSKIFSFLANNVERSLQRYGWRQIDTCSQTGAAQWADFLEQTCPLAETVIWTVVNNTITLFRFYKYLADSNCLQNSSIPCLKPAKNVHATPAEAFPRIKHLRAPNNSAVNASIDVSTDNEPVIAAFINTIDLFLEWIDIGSTSRQEVLWGFLSTDAAFNETEFSAQINANEFSIGRILREFFTCDLEETLECERVRSPLAASFAAMFSFLLLFTLFVPLPSVVTFFLWTLGLTYGVVYLSYGFSPLCWPRAPVCLGQGLYDVVLDIFPEQLVFSSQLKQERACANFHVDSSVQFIIAVETFYRGGRASTTQQVLEICSKRIELQLCINELASIEPVAENLADVESRTAMYYCTLFNAYRIVALVCALIFFGPPILYITGMVLPLFIHLCSLGVSSVYFLLQLNGSVGTETTEGAVVDS